MRDPKVDPAPDDILRLNDSRERQVLKVDDKLVVYFDVWRCGRCDNKTCSLSAWRNWAKKPEVLVVQQRYE